MNIVPGRAWLPALPLLAAVAACGSAGSGAEREATATPVEKTGSVADSRSAAALRDLFDFGMSFGTSRHALEAKLGPPQAIAVELAPNRHVPEATDSIFTVSYPGLIFRLNRPGPVERELLVEVLLFGRDYEMPGGLEIGASRDGATGLLGPATSRAVLGDTLVSVYEVPQSDAHEFVQLYFIEDEVRRVRWLPYVD